MSRSPSHGNHESKHGSLKELGEREPDPPSVAAPDHVHVSVTITENPDIDSLSVAPGWRELWEIGRGSFSRVLLVVRASLDAAPTLGDIHALKLFSPQFERDRQVELAILRLLNTECPESAAGSSTASPATGARVHPVSDTGLPSLSTRHDSVEAAPTIRRRRRWTSESGEDELGVPPSRPSDRPNGEQYIVSLQGETTSAIVLEACLAGDLRDYVMHRHRAMKCSKLGSLLPEPSVRRIAFQLALAISHCHSRGVVIRDLKLENILLTHSGEVRVSDFGLSFCGEFTATTGIHQRSGTIAYMAPEVFSRSKHPGRSSATSEDDHVYEHGSAVDWWSLGAICYELLVGSPPFHRSGSTEQEHMHRIKESELVFPEWVSMSSTVSEDAVAFVSGLLCKDPAERLGAKERGIDEVLRHSFFGKSRGALRKLASEPVMDFDDEGAWEWNAHLARVAHLREAHDE
jgi:serine/threonine protein kinase